MLKPILISLLITSCHYHDKKVEIDPTKLELLQAKRDFYCSQNIDPYKQVQRCDGLTFIGIYDAYCQKVDIYSHEYTIKWKEDSVPVYKVNDIKNFENRSGRWNRDVVPCYNFDLDGDGKGDSRSGSSLENEISSMLSLFMRRDLDGLERKLGYLNLNKWVANEGPQEYTKVWELNFLLKKMIDRLRGFKDEEPTVFPMSSFVPTSIADSDGLRVYEEINKKLQSVKGYRGKVISHYIATKVKVFGYMNEYEKRLLQLCLEHDPDNPLYNILWGKYQKDGQNFINRAIDRLLDEKAYPSDKLPGHIDSMNWGDDLGQALYAWMINMLEE